MSYRKVLDRGCCNRENHSRKKNASGKIPPVATFDRQFTVRESFECITYNSVNINFPFSGKKNWGKIFEDGRVHGLMKVGQASNCRFGIITPACIF